MVLLSGREDKMFIPDSVKNAMPKDPTNNTFFHNADMMWKRLELIRNDEIEFIDCDMAILSNVVELYYKGFIIASGIRVPESLINESHSLVRLTEQIETQIMPLSAPLSKTDERDRRNFLFDLQNMYIDARYGYVDVTKKDFNYCFDWAKKQKDLILETLKPKIFSNTKRIEDVEY